jgi:hypothetical protein
MFLDLVSFLEGRRWKTLCEVIMKIMHYSECTVTCGQWKFLQTHRHDRRVVEANLGHPKRHSHHRRETSGVKQRPIITLWVISFFFHLLISFHLSFCRRNKASIVMGWGFRPPSSTFEAFQRISVHSQLSSVMASFAFLSFKTEWFFSAFREWTLVSFSSRFVIQFQASYGVLGLLYESYSLSWNNLYSCVWWDFIWMTKSRSTLMW